MRTLTKKFLIGVIALSMPLTVSHAFADDLPPIGPPDADKINSTETKPPAKVDTPPPAVPSAPVAVPATPAVPAISVDESIQKAKAEIARNRFSEARAILKQSINANPKELKLYLEYYPLTVKTNDWSQAVQTLETIFELDPAKESEYYVGYGDAYYKLRKMDKAQMIYDKALGFGKDKDVIHRKLIDVAKQQKSESLLEKEYAEYLKLKPTDGEMQFEFANLLYKLKRNKEALAHYRLASDNRPYDSYTHERLAYILLYEKDYAGSIDAYRKAIAANPRDSRLIAALKYAREQQKLAAKAAAPAVPATPTKK